MRILITGGTGFIGSRLALRLLRGENAVRVLSLINTPAEAANAERLRAAGAELIVGSVADRSLHAAAVEGCDVVHHIAATMREANVAERVFWDTNLQATQDLAAASRRSGVRRFVYCSTMGVTGEVKGRVVDESAPYRPNPGDIYQRTKAAAEQWLLEEAGRAGLPVTAVRPVDVYGPGDQRLLKLFRMIRKGTFFYLGSGNGYRHMIYVDDLVEGMCVAQEHPAAVGEAFYLAGPRPVRLRELVEIIAKAFGTPVPRLHLPYRPVRLLSAAVEQLCRPLGIQPPIYPRRIDFYAHDFRFDTSKARRLLDFEASVDIEEGVERTISAYRAEGLLPEDTGASAAGARGAQ